MDEREALVVLEHDVVARLVSLDQVVFQQQRFSLGIGDRDFDFGDLLDQRLNLRVNITRREVGADSVFETLRLSDVEQVMLGIEHAIYARAPRQRRSEFLGVEFPRVHEPIVRPIRARARPPF